ncbi:MAG TPA: 3-deoxy-7-phosphoheptulonate synthase [Gemmatimonadales bacterium]|nr:3-deoxy-7-phosphoheptulonate synthase [Gemmatimonadales bacterium]
MTDSRSLVPETSNLHVLRMSPLATPRQMRDELPVPRATAVTVVDGRRAVRRVLAGEDQRLLVVVGPCSIHDPTAALEYAGRLAALRSEVDDALCLMMRVYFEKPRTTVGWKGLINDPHLDGSRDLETGLRLARRILLEVNGLGLPAATEMLGVVIPQYIADLVSWTGIGARTAESQTHREMASGLSMPVGFKNTTDGNLQIALDGLVSAATPHSFVGLDDEGRVAIVHTSGNPDRHLVLRGGAGNTNYDAASIHRAVDLLRLHGQCPRLMVDCSHGNSQKDHRKQAVAMREVLAQIAAGERAIMGVMVESHLHAGNQRLEGDPSKLRYGVSITDACMDWETTAELIREAAATMRRAIAARVPAPQRA